MYFLWENPHMMNSSLEAMIPRSLIVYIGKLLNIDITDTTANNVPLLLQN